MKKLIFLILLASSISSGQTLEVLSDSTKEVGTVNKFAFDINMQFPKFSFGAGALMGVRGIASDMQMVIDSMNKAQINSFKKNLNDFTYSDDFKDMTSSLTTIYTVEFLKNSYVSIAMLHYEIIAGMAHPYQYTYTFNYDYVNKGLISFQDLFLPKSGYLKFVSNYCIKDLKAQVKDADLGNMDDMIKEGAGAKLENFQTFSVDDKGISIIFSPGQAAPNVVGGQMVFIPKNKISKYVDTAGPLSFWWSN